MIAACGNIFDCHAPWLEAKKKRYSTTYAAAEELTKKPPRGVKVSLPSPQSMQNFTGPLPYSACREQRRFSGNKD
jgi:hypothetical protein